MKNYLQDVQPKLTVDNYTNASQTLNPKMDANADLTSQPRPMNPNIKQTGAPVPFSTKSAETINIFTYSYKKKLVCYLYFV